MARLPKPLVPTLVGVSAVALGLFTMAPSFASTTPPVDPITTVAPTPTPTSEPPTAAPEPTTTIVWPDDLQVSIRPSKPDPLRDPITPASTVGSCINCLDDPNP